VSRALAVQPTPLGLVNTLRLGLFQGCLGCLAVIFAGLLNRVMLSELNFPGLLATVAAEVVEALRTHLERAQRDVRAVHRLQRDARARHVEVGLAHEILEGLNDLLDQIALHETCLRASDVDVRVTHAGDVTSRVSTMLPSQCRSINQK